MSKHTPAPWSVRTLVRNEKIVDCFVTANDVNGFAHKAEIMGDDEYRDGIDRKLADDTLISAAPDLLEALEGVVLLAREMFEHWDSDRDAKVGKYLLAISGQRPGYDKRTDEILAAISKARG